MPPILCRRPRPGAAAPGRGSGVACLPSRPAAGPVGAGTLQPGVPNPRRRLPRLPAPRDRTSRASRSPGACDRPGDRGRGPDPAAIRGGPKRPVPSQFPASGDLPGPEAASPAESSRSASTSGRGREWLGCRILHTIYRGWARPVQFRDRSTPAPQRLARFTGDDLRSLEGLDDTPVRHRSRPSRPSGGLAGRFSSTSFNAGSAIRSPRQRINNPFVPRAWGMGTAQGERPIGRRWVPDPRPLSTPSVRHPTTSGQPGRSAARRPPDVRPAGPA